MVDHGVGAAIVLDSTLFFNEGFQEHLPENVR
jgi:hypothetical protein